MNLNQAKSAAGIPASESITGRAAIERAIRQCVKAIIVARKAGNDDQAARLSEAKEVFRKRLGRNGCAVCGVTIGRGATHCQAHYRRKALPSHNPTPQKAESARGNSNARIDVAPIGGMKATLGFYAEPVQYVLKKWAGKNLRPEWIEDIFIRVAMPVRFRESEMKVTIPYHQLWKFVADLMMAVTELYTDRSKPAYWLLSLPNSVATNGKYPSFEDIRDEVIKNSGPAFTTGQLRTAYSRLKLATPKELANEFRSYINRPVP